MHKVCTKVILYPSHIKAHYYYVQIFMTSELFFIKTFFLLLETVNRGEKK